MSVQIRLEPPGGARPGTSATASAWVKNGGDVVETYDLDVVGGPCSRADVEPPSLSLMPGDESRATITFRVPAADRVPGGRMAWGLRAQAETDPLDRAVEDGQLEIEGVTVLGCELLPETALGRRRSQHRVVIENRGNAAADVTVSARDEDEVLDLRVETAHLTLPAGSTREVGIKVTSRDRGRVQHGFTVTVSETDGSTTVLRGALDQRPLSKALWQIPVLVVALVLAAFLVKRNERARSIYAGSSDTTAASTITSTAPPQATSSTVTATGAGTATVPGGGGGGGPPPPTVSTVVTTPPGPVTTPTAPPPPVQNPTTTLGAPPLPTTSDQNPCGSQTTRSGHRVQYCPLWRANVPVYDSPTSGNSARQIDTLYQGGSTNWFVGQSQHSSYTSGAYTNNWWAFTLGDNGRWGWVSQVFFTGGRNNERDAGLFLCGTQGNTCR